MMSCIALHVLANIIFGITQKPLCIKKGLGAKEKLTFKIFFDNPLSKYFIFKRVSDMHWLFVIGFTKIKNVSGASY